LIRALAFVLIAGWAGVLAPALAWSQPVPSRWPDAFSSAEFRSELDRLAHEIRSTAQTSDASTLAKTIPYRWRVDVGDRQRLDVNTRWLTTALESAGANGTTWPETREALSQRLERMRDEIAPTVDNEVATRSRAQTSVQAILSREEFRQGAVSRWREDLRERITRWIEALFDRLGITGQTGERTVRILAWAIGFAALGGLGVWLARTMTQRPRQLLELGSRGAPRPRAHDLALRAIGHARAGDVREAVRVAYHAALVRMEEQGVWRIDDARTPREYVRMLDAGDARRPPILDMTRRFEQIWYGNRAAGDDDAASVATHLEVLGCLRPGERAI
jgi:uncharacterized protein DUF4129